MKKRILASLLSLCLIVGLLPAAALAADESGTDGETPVVCTMDGGCEAETHDEGCPQYAAPEEPAPCALTEGCTLEAGHEGECALPDEPEAPADPAEDEEASGAAEPTIEEQLAALIAALPNPADIDPEDEEQAEEVYNQISEIYAFAGENGLDVEDNEIILAVIAALYPAEPLDDPAPVDEAMSGNCGAEGSENSVTWALTQNNKDDSNPTYTLTISGSGDMKDFDVATGDGANKAPWFTALSGSTTSITAVTIGDDVTSIGDYALSKLSNLKTINGNDTSSSKKIVFPAQLTSWGYSLNGSGLSGVLSFPENCQLEDEDSLNIFGNNNITGVDWTNYPLTSVPAHWTEYGTAHTALTDLGLNTLPSTVNSIGEYAFKNFQGTSIEIPDTSIQYGVGTFVNSKLATATINVEKEGSALSENMFSASKDLTTVNFVGNNLGKIPAGSFHDTKLSYLAVPYGVTTIESNSSTDMEHASTFGVSSNSNLDTAVAFIFPSTLTKIEANNSQDELFGNRTASNVSILAPASFDWGTMDGGLKEIEAGNTIGSDFNGLYRYTLATEATYGDDAVEVFSVTTPSNADETFASTFGTLSYEIEDETVLDSELKPVSVGKTKVEVFITAPNNSIKTKIAETTITVKPRVLSFSYKDSGSGSITYDYSGDAPALSQFMTFAWNDEPKTTVTLDEGTQVNYTYTLDTASGGSGKSETYDELPTNVGQYSVTLNLIDPNYTFYLTGGDSGTSNTLSITVNVKAEGKTRVYLASAAPKGEVFTYNGAGIMPVEGVLQAYAEDSTTSATVDIGQFTISIRGMNDTVFEESSVTVGAGTDLSSLTGLTLPVKPGQYQITASASNDDYYLYKTLVFAIDKATVTIKANDKTAYVGDEVPALGAEDYTVTGLVGSDTLTTAPTLSYEGAPDMSTTGTYTIKASGAAAGNNYTITYVDGTLTVSTRSSGGSSGGGSSSGNSGNVTGSGDNVNVDVSGGSVTAAQMEKAVDKADRGETITIEASSRSSVSLPSSGLQDAADNNNDVTVELKNGEVTLSPEALSAVAEQAGTTVTLTVDPVSANELNSRQKAAVGDAPVFDLTIKSGGKTITDFDGGLVTVAIPYELPDGQDPAGVVVWFMDDNGNITACETMYDLRTETVIFTTRHFSKYVIGYVEPMAFTDVPADAYYAAAVAWAVENGITSGTGDGTTFSPDISCTRAQMMTFLWRAAGSPAPKTTANPFTDVQADAYYYDAVLWAVENGITTGTGDTTFSPDATVTRGQTVTFMYRAAGSPAVIGSSFADVAEDAYYADAVAWAVEEGITAGTGGNTFSPDAACTRAQIVTFLYRDAQ